MPTTRRGSLRQTVGAVYGLLNVVSMTTVATGGVHQARAPQGTTRPYVVIESPRSEAWDAMQQPGEEGEFWVRAVCEVDYMVALQILGLAQQLVDGERPTIDANHLCVQLKWVRNIAYPDPEMVNSVPVWHAVATFRFLVDQVA